jgi:hypothetical protein
MFRTAPSAACAVVSMRRSGIGHAGAAAKLSHLRL